MSGLEADRGTLEGSGLSNESCWHSPTVQQAYIEESYAARGQVYVSWCDERGFDPFRRLRAKSGGAPREVQVVVTEYSRGFW